jgi:integrase
MKYSVVLLLYMHRPNDKGQYPIYIRITINRKQSYLSTGYYLEPKYWDAKGERVKETHMLAGTINADITTRKHTIIKKIVDYQVKGERITAAAIKDLVSNKTDLHNIFEFTELFIKEVQHKRKPGTLENYRKHLLVLEKYHGSRSLAFEEITHEYLVGFEDHLRNPVKDGIGKRDALGGNYIHAIWKTIKTFFNAAQKRAVISYYPFDAYENPTYEAPRKDYMTIADLDYLENIADTTKDYVKKETTVYALLGSYTGLRVSDWRTFNVDQHVQDGRLLIRAKKNGEWVTMPVIGRLARHLERIKNCPFTISEQEVNRTLKDLFPKKKIRTHGCRHTFAITWCAERGISAETCSELMGIKLQTCVENYYKITNIKIDKECLGAWK